jgi:hypothetical protein
LVFSTMLLNKTFMLLFLGLVLFPLPHY